MNTKKCLAILSLCKYGVVQDTAFDMNMDLSFLDGESGGDEMATFVESLSSIVVVYFKNSDPDMRVLEVKDQEGLDSLINSIFSGCGNMVQIVVPNSHLSVERCGFFRLVMSEYTPKSPVNFKLETFMKMAGISNISVRCEQALVIGMDQDTKTCLSVPSVFRLTSIEHLQLLGDIDITCLQSAHVASHRGCRNLMDIPGIPLPRFFPDEIAWNILKYCEHPAAAIMKSYWKELDRFWDLHFQHIMLQWQIDATLDLLYHHQPG